MKKLILFFVIGIGFLPVTVESMIRRVAPGQKLNIGVAVGSCLPSNIIDMLSSSSNNFPNYCIVTLTSEMKEQFKKNSNNANALGDNVLVIVDPQLQKKFEQISQQVFTENFRDIRYSIYYFVISLGAWQIYFIGTTYWIESFFNVLDSWDKFVRKVPKKQENTEKTSYS